MTKVEAPKVTRSQVSLRDLLHARAVGVIEGGTETGKLRYGDRRAMHEEEC